MKPKSSIETLMLLDKIASELKFYEDGAGRTDCDAYLLHCRTKIATLLSRYSNIDLMFDGVTQLINSIPKNLLINKSFLSDHIRSMVDLSLSLNSDASSTALGNSLFN